VTVPAPSLIHLNADPSIADVVAVADGAPVELGEDAVARILAARATVDRLVNGERLIYGLNTGLGHLRDERVPVEVLRRYQAAIVAAHAGAVGEPLPTATVRAAIFVRLAGIARGGAGASLPIARGLAALLNAGVHPVVPATGSVGAADLMHMAAIAAVLTGAGQAELGGEVLPGAEALRRAGLASVQLEPKDGLALVSANGVSVGGAALLVERAERLADAADLVLAVSLEAVRGNPSIIEPAAVVAKPVPGQATSADRIRGHLAGSDRWRPDGTASVQDPLSFRVGPQVHGALREFLALLRRQVELELAASDDNPLVLASENRMVSNGNFHPIAMALAVDALRPALAHVGQISDRRMNHLWAARFADPSVLDPAAMDQLAVDGPLLRYAAAAIAAELRSDAGPVTLDIGVLDLGVEDHATNAPAAVVRTVTALDRLAGVLGVELLLAAEVIRRSAAAVGRLGAGTSAALDELAAVVATIPAPRDAAALHAAVTRALVGRILGATGPAGR
jgi:histidine ammonia-lyase